MWYTTRPTAEINFESQPCDTQPDRPQRRPWPRKPTNRAAESNSNMIRPTADPKSESNRRNRRRRTFDDTNFFLQILVSLKFSSISMLLVSRPSKKDPILSQIRKRVKPLRSHFCLKALFLFDTKPLHCRVENWCRNATNLKQHRTHRPTKKSQMLYSRNVW